jgi:hypothetical protein
MLSDFPVLYVDGIVRRTIATCVLLGFAVLMGALFAGQYLAGIGVVLGLAGATLNHRLFQISTAHYSDSDGHLQRKPYAGSVAARLGGLTLIAFALMFFVRPMGFGMVGGLVAFQMVLMANAFVALWQYQKTQLRGLTGAGGGHMSAGSTQSYPGPTGGDDIAGTSEGNADV